MRRRVASRLHSPAMELSRRAFAVFVVVLAASAPSGLCRAQDAPADQVIAQAREHVLFARYPEAIAAARGLLERSDASARQINLALEITAIAQIANRQADAAVQTLARLYVRDPEHRLADPDASPPVIAAFARAREARPEPVRPELRPLPHETVTRRELPTITLEIGAGADAVEEVRLAYHVAGAAGFSQLVMDRTAPSTWRGRIPVSHDARTSTEIEYYLSALAPSGQVLGSVGSEQAPLTLRAVSEESSSLDGSLRAAGEEAGEPAPSRGIASEPWFWIVLGGVVVAGGVTAGVLIATSQAPAGPDAGTLGIVTLMH
jgi:hypothetical protein